MLNQQHCDTQILSGSVRRTPEKEFGLAIFRLFNEYTNELTPKEYSHFDIYISCLLQDIKYNFSRQFYDEDTLRAISDAAEKIMSSSPSASQSKKTEREYNLAQLEKLLDFLVEVLKLNFKLDIIGELDKLVAPMGKVAREVDAGTTSLKIPQDPLLHIKAWYAVEAVLQKPGVILPPRFDTKRQNALKAYLIDKKSLSELQAETEQQNRGGVSLYLQRGLRMVFPYLPEEVRIQLESVENVFQARAADTPTNLSERISQGLLRGVPDGEKKRFSDTRRNHLSAAASRRWKRWREVGKLNGELPFSEQGLENIKRGRNITHRKAPTIQ